MPECMHRTEADDNRETPRDADAPVAAFTESAPAGAVEVSHGGDKVAFYSDSSGRIELYILDVKTKAVTQLSHGEVPRALRSFFIWDPTDRYLVFAKDNAGDEQHDLFRIDATTCWKTVAVVPSHTITP